MDEENDSESEESDVMVSDCDLGEENMELEEESDSEDKRDLQEVSRCKVLTFTINQFLLGGFCFQPIDLTGTVSDCNLEDVSEQRGLEASGSASNPIDFTGW